MRVVFLSALLVALACPAYGQDTIDYKNAQLTLIDNVTVASLDPGVVRMVHVQPGERVTQGTVLADLDQETYQAEAKAAALQSAIANQEFQNDVNLRFAQKSMAVNQKRLQKSLNAVRAFAMSISETEIDRLTLERDQSELSAEQAELEREIARLTVDLREEQKRTAEILLARRTITSPIDGLVVEVPVQAGQSVGTGEGIARVISLKTLRVKAVYPAEFALRVKRESKAYFEVMDGNESVRVDAKVFFVSPEVLPSERVFEVWADVDNVEAKLLPGIKGTLVIELK